MQWWGWRLSWAAPAVSRLAPPPLPFCFRSLLSHAYAVRAYAVVDIHVRWLYLMQVMLATVIIELTNDTNLVAPVGVASIISMIVGNFFNHGLYHGLIAVCHWSTVMCVCVCVTTASCRLTRCLKLPFRRLHPLGEESAVSQFCAVGRDVAGAGGGRDGSVGDHVEEALRCSRDRRADRAMRLRRHHSPRVPGRGRSGDGERTAFEGARGACLPDIYVYVYNMYMYMYIRRWQTATAGACKNMAALGWRWLTSEVAVARRGS
jgi:hypothetical protein